MKFNIVHLQWIHFLFVWVFLSSLKSLSLSLQSHFCPSSCSKDFSWDSLWHLVYLLNFKNYEKFKKEILKNYKTIDILINCAAMVGTNKSAGWNTVFKNQNLKSWNNCLNVNLTSAVWSLVVFNTSFDCFLRIPLFGWSYFEPSGSHSWNSGVLAVWSKAISTILALSRAISTILALSRNIWGHLAV